MIKVNTIKVITKRPGQNPWVREIGNTLENFRDILKGDLELVTPRDLLIYKIDLFCNEHWRDNFMLPNLYHEDWAYDGFVGGPILLMSHDNFGDAIGLETYQIHEAKKWLAEHTVEII